MAIQFPPNPDNGDTFIYLVTQEEFVCHRDGSETPQWACQGTFNDKTFAYQGSINIQDPAPNAETGYIYSVSDGGIADDSFTGLAGQTVEQWSLIIYADPEWVLVSVAATSPWLRTVDGRIQPITTTDNLDMVDGNYLINNLPDLE